MQPRMSTRAKLVLAGCGIVSILCLFGAWAVTHDLVGQISGEKKFEVLERQFDFRGTPVPKEFKNSLSPKVTKVEAEGLRITFSPPSPPVSSGALNLKIAELEDFKNVEDFEATATIEFIPIVLATKAPAAPPPKIPVKANAATDSATAVYLSVSGSEARVGRVSRSDGTQEIESVLANKVNGKPTRQIVASPCTDDLLRLRLKRTSGILHFLWAPGASGDKFEEIHKCVLERGIGDPMLRFEAPPTTQGRAAALDVRLIDFRISRPIAEVLAANKIKPKTPLSVKLLTGFGLATALGGMWYFVKQRAHLVKLRAAAGIESRQADIQPVQTFISFPCSKCGRGLQAGSDQAGKKVKCPKCDNQMLVPEPVETA